MLGALAAVWALASASTSDAARVEEANAAFRAGDYDRAARLAEQLQTDSPDDEDVRRFRAAAVNAVGVALAEEGRWVEATEIFAEAHAINPDDEDIEANLHLTTLSAALTLAREEARFEEALAHVERVPSDASPEISERRQAVGNLVHVLWAREEAYEGDGEAQRHRLGQALAWSDDNVEAMIDLAQIHYSAREFDEAQVLCREALEIDPDLTDVRRLSLLMSRDRQATEGHTTRTTDRFAVSHLPRLREFSDTCLYVLEQSHREFSEAFGHVPRRRIEVIIYDEVNFRHVTLAPDWAQAGYDGRIRVFATDFQTNEQRRRLQDTLSHELAHAFVLHIAGGNCPDWLNEGLALNFETNFQHGRTERAHLALLRADGELIPFGAMPESFAEVTSSDQARVLYWQAAGFTAMLLRRFGARGVREVLDHLRSGLSTEEAIERGLGFSLDELDRQWRESL